MGAEPDTAPRRGRDREDLRSPKSPQRWTLETLGEENGKFRNTNVHVGIAQPGAPPPSSREHCWTLLSSFFCLFLASQPFPSVSLSQNKTNPI
jgi:hypothetical protein